MTAGRWLPVGRVAGRRGVAGELTVRVPAGDATWWDSIEEVWIGSDEGSSTCYAVEGSRSYRDRLVLKLAGIDDAGAAEGLRGLSVWASRERAPAQPQGRWYVTALVGMQVDDERLGAVGTVNDVMPTGGGADLLVVGRPESAEDLLVPMVEEIVLTVDEGNRRIHVRLPDGLMDLND